MRRLQVDLATLNEASMDEARHLTNTQIELITVKNDLDLAKQWLEKVNELVSQPREFYIVHEFLSCSIDVLVQDQILVEPLGQML